MIYKVLVNYLVFKRFFLCLWFTIRWRSYSVI